MTKKLWQQIFQYVLAAIIVGALVATVMVLIRVEVSPSVHDALMLLLGVEASGFTTVVNYFFGSSQGSHNKTELMSNGKPQ